MSDDLIPDPPESYELRLSPAVGAALNLRFLCENLKPLNERVRTHAAELGDVLAAGPLSDESHAATAVFFADILPEFMQIMGAVVDECERMAEAGTSLVEIIEQRGKSDG